MKPWLSSLPWLGMLVISLGAIAWTTSSLGVMAPKAPNSVAQAGANLVLLLGDNPYKIEFDPVRVDVPWDPGERERYVGWIADPLNNELEDPSRSRRLHAARLHSLLGNTPEWLIRDHQTLETHVRLPKQAVWHTWRGLEMAESPEGKRTEHRDQTLAALAELGVPLSAVLESEDGAFHVYDLLRTSMGEFHQGQEEISWTAAAYIRYLPPQTTWQNRYGERFSLDNLVEEIIRRPLTRESCRGIHLVMAMTQFAKVDRDLGILSPDIRGRLLSYLRNKLSEAVSTQLDDGSWPSCWSPSGFATGVTSITPADSDLNGVIVAGHLLEWFHLLPSEMKPPARSVKAGTLWIRSKLRSSSRAAVTEGFCPYTHAIVCLDLAARPQTQ